MNRALDATKADYEANASTFVTSLAKGLEVVRCFGEGSERLTLSEVATKTGFSRATARRFLHTLTSLGYARNDGKHFELTPKVLTLGHAYLSSLNIWDSSGTFLEEVTRQTNESCNLAILDGGEVVYIARSAAPHRIMSVSLFVGARLPAHATSMGQVLLAAMEPKKLNAFLARYPLDEYTSRTFSKASALRERLEEIRQSGFAVADQELEVGLRSIAVPVGNRHGTVVAAMNVSAHSARVSKNTMIQEYLPHLLCAAEKLKDIAD